MYLLDTNVLIALSTHLGGIADRLDRIAAAEVVIPVVVVAEIEFGIAKSRRRRQNRRVSDNLLAGFEVAAFDAAAAAACGPIRADLERRGSLIGPNDLLIAAQAISLGGILVTDNVAEFQRIADLRLENWLAEP